MSCVIATGILGDYFLYLSLTLTVWDHFCSNEILESCRSQPVQTFKRLDLCHLLRQAWCCPANCSVPSLRGVFRGCYMDCPNTQRQMHVQQHRHLQTDYCICKSTGPLIYTHTHTHVIKTIWCVQRVGRQSERGVLRFRAWRSLSHLGLTGLGGWVTAGHTACGTQRPGFCLDRETHSAFTYILKYVWLQGVATRVGNHHLPNTGWSGLWWVHLSILQCLQD